MVNSVHEKGFVGLLVDRWPVMDEEPRFDDVVEDEPVVLPHPDGFHESIRTHFRMSGLMEGMGGNRRYPGRGIDHGIHEILIRAQPISLTDAELDLDHHPVHTPEEPRPVRAWLRFPETVIQPECEAIAWTDQAVQIRWTSVSGIIRVA
jgi:hypothetical protein